MAKKRGVSPLIATVLIIGFTIALAALVITWGVPFTKKQTAGVEEEFQTGLSLVGKVHINLKSVEVLPDNSLKLTIENKGSKDIEKVHVRFFNKTGNLDSILTDSGVPAYTIEEFTVPYDPALGELVKVEVFPQVLSEGKKVSLPDVSDYQYLVSGDTGGAVPGGCEPNPDLISWWPGDGNTNDIIGGKNGVPHGHTFADGKVGQAFSFDGNSYVDIESLNAPEGPYTLEGWAISYKDSLTGWNTLIEFGNDSPWFGVEGGDLTMHNAVNGGSISVDVWYHFAYTFDGTNSRLYLNGGETGSLVKSPPTGGLGMGIGKHRYDLGWEGLIDEVSLYNRALGADEILDIYQADSNGKCKPA